MMSITSLLPHQSLEDRIKETNSMIAYLSRSLTSLKENWRADIDPRMMLAKLKREKLKASAAFVRSQTILEEMNILVAVKELKMELAELAVVYKDQRNIREPGPGNSSKLNHRTASSTPLKDNRLNQKSVTKSKSDDTMPALHRLNKSSTRISKSATRTNCHRNSQEKQASVVKQRVVKECVDTRDGIKQAVGKQAVVKERVDTQAVKQPVVNGIAKQAGVRERVDKQVLKQAVVKERVNTQGVVKQPAVIQGMIKQAVCRNLAQTFSNIKTNQEKPITSNNVTQRVEKADNTRNRSSIHSRDQRLDHSMSSKSLNTIQNTLKTNNTKNFHATKPTNNNTMQYINTPKARVVNEVFQEVMKAKKMKRETDTKSISSAKTAHVCFQCGYVEDDHLCPWPVTMFQ